MVIRTAQVLHWSRGRLACGVSILTVVLLAAGLTACAGNGECEGTSCGTSRGGGDAATVVDAATSSSPTDAGAAPMDTPDAETAPAVDGGTASGSCPAGANACTNSACAPRCGDGCCSPEETGCGCAADCGASCDDGDPCTYDDLCSGTTCQGTAVTCTSDACTVRTCNGTATCSVTNATPGTPCADDGNPCTVDVCGPSGTCVHEPVADGTSCGSDDRCCNGACTSLNDDNNCGGCGIRCPAGNRCGGINGEYVCSCYSSPSCPSGQTCVDDSVAGSKCSCNGASACASGQSCVDVRFTSLRACSY